MTSPHRSSGQRASQPAPSAQSRGGWQDRLWAALGATSAIFAVVGALSYLVLSLVCTAVYSPLGLTPAEVGLDYGTLLAQSAVAVAALTVIAILTGLAVVAFRIAIVIVIAALAAAAYVLLVSARARQHAKQQAAALAPVVGTVIVFTFALGLAGNALDGANDLRDGRRPSAFFVGIPAPWRAETARVTWTGTGSSSEIRFPDCLLYLGEASGTTVFYDARSDVQEALRVRSDNITIAITHKRRSCPA
jgi:hypothetical protein